jgi:hypothetical protein
LLRNSEQQWMHHRNIGVRLPVSMRTSSERSCKALDNRHREFHF